MFEERLSNLPFINREAERVSHECIRFSFGANWKRYLSSIDESHIKHAENSFLTFTRLSSLAHHTFLDIGCGSGLSSLVAYRLGARRIVSVDIDPNCIDCAKALRARFADHARKWEILRGSALDRDFLASLGRFSYVYSWGALHHTGSMWRAVENLIGCVDNGGKVHIALYNAHKNSATWLKVKRVCNRFPRSVFPVLRMSYGLLIYARLLARARSPARYVRQYREQRGMTFSRDIEDWFGGLPYEYCTPDQVIDLLSDRGFVLLRLKSAGSIGCNEFLFRHEGYCR